MDAGPEILARSPHGVVAASYHRNQQAMVDTITAFSGSAEDLRRIAAERGADYVAVCLAANDFALYRTASAGNAANMLAGEAQPTWLAPIKGFDGVLRVWRIRPDGTPAPRR